MKYVKLILLTYLLYGVILDCIAQTKAEHKITLGGGVSVLARQDLVYSPFVHSDLSFHSYNLKYVKEKRFHQYLQAGFTYNTSQIGSSANMAMDDHMHMILPHEFLNLNLTYGFGKLIYSGKKYKDRAGVSFQSELQATYYNFVLSQMFGYYINQSANIWYSRDYHIKKHQLRLQCEIPLLSWLSRPPYLAEDDEFIENISSHNNRKIVWSFIQDGNLVTWNELQRLDFSVEYVFLVSQILGIGINYQFDFIHSSQPKTLLSYQNQVHITTGIKF